MSKELPREKKIATLEKIRNVVGNIPIDEAWYYLRRAMWEAEENGQCHSDVYGPYYQPCTYWIIGDYIVTYLTEDPYFCASLLTEEMLDGLIIERA